MEYFLRQNIEYNRFELEIDTKIFYKEVILQSAFQFLDLGYFFFKTVWESSILLQFTPKEGVKVAPEVIIWDFSDTLLEMILRYKLEKDNKIVRETIITKAINGPLDMQNFVSLDSTGNHQKNQIDFDKDIDEILKEIENDPDLQIDESEINKILDDIENETESELQKPQLNLDVDALKDFKAKIKKTN